MNSAYRKYVKYYSIKNAGYQSRKIHADPDSVSAFLIQQNCSLFEFYGSLFALYLSRMNRMDGCLLKTAFPAEETGQSDRTALLMIEIGKEERFTDLLQSFHHACKEAAAQKESDPDPEVTYYCVRDHSSQNGGNGADADSVLTLNIGEGFAELFYHTDIFTDDFMDRMARNLNHLAVSLIREPETAAGHVDILSKEENEQLSEFSRGKTVEADRNLLFSQAFRNNALASPDDPAVEDGECTISYGEMERSSNALAFDLYETHGIRPGSRVGLILPRNYHYPEMVLALNKIGAAFVPIDPQLPENRMRHMIEIAQAEQIVAAKSVGEALNLDTEIIFFEDLNRENDREFQLRTEGDSLFAILFTSGTTGVPKGVMFYNNQIPWMFMSFADMFHLTSGSLVGSYFSFSFVASFIIFAAMYLNGCVRMFDEEEQKNPLLLIKALNERHMRCVVLPPAVGIPVYESEDLDLDYLIVAGAKVNRLSRTERAAKLVNIYGTTEVVICLWNVFDLKNMQEDRIPLGKPLPNTWVYILDQENHQMPIGVPGEICVSGRLISRGYYNDSELTAARFVPNPYADCEGNKIMYRTGDIGFYNADGEVEIVGREDDQLSVRGFRVESGEIIKIMKEFPEITGICLDAENDVLTAFYTANGEVEEDRIREALSRELPYYMIPSLFLKLDQIPLNRNGKIDRVRLKSIMRQEMNETGDEILRTVMEAFRTVLHADAVLPDDRFAALGGNSLAAMKLQLLLKEKWNIILSANELIALSTPEMIADHIRTAQNSSSALNPDRYSFDGPCPLLESQLNVYLDESVHDRGSAYNNPFLIRWKDLNRYSVSKIKDAVLKLYDIFPVLKARVVNQSGTLSLRFDAEPVITEGNLEDVNGFVRRFDPSQYLCRFLIAEEKEALVLCADFHHLIFDGTSLNILLDQFFAVLNGETAGEEDRGLLREAAFEESISAEAKEEANAFFDMMLADREEAYDLYPSPGEAACECTHAFEVNRKQLNAFLRSHSITENQFFAGVFAYTLSRFSGSEKVLFSLIEDGRGHMDLSRSVGMFVKTLPVLLDCGNRTVSQYLKDASAVINSVMRYDLVPFRTLAGKYDLSAKIQFQYSHNIFADALKRSGMECEIEPCAHDLDADFSFNILNDKDGRLQLRILCSSMYSGEFAQRFAEAYQRILAGMISAEELRDISYISESDTALLNRWNNTDLAVRDGDILDFWNESLRKVPEGRLVEYNDVSYTFAQSAFIAEKIQKELLGLGVNEADRVGFLVQRCHLYVFCVLGIMSAGAAYVPLDDALPDERIRFMVQDAGCRILIVSDETMPRAAQLAPQAVLLNLSDMMKESGTLDYLPVIYGETACILYTSGSTGQPKGVKIRRESLKFFIDFQVRDLRLKPGDVYGMYASIGFDVSMGAIFSAMVSGACVSVIPECMKLDIQALNQYFMEHHVTHTHITTQIARLFIREIETTSLKVLVTGGEKLGEISEKRDYRIVDTYGPTEACVYVTSIDLSAKTDSDSVGTLLSNVKAYVLDGERRRVPAGAVGELYLSGPQTADGYLNRKEETLRAFSDNPFEDSEKYRRLYRTGDVAKYLPDGTVCIIGRRDGQVKVRGNRVELSGIEAVLREIEGVNDVTVRVISQGGNNELATYIVSDSLDENELEAAVSGYMNGRVPGYMIPAFVVKLDRIPVNVNGKVDRRALPEIDFRKLQAEYAEPKTELEAKIVRGFEQVFHQERISVNDDFVRLGGDSLAAVQLLSLLETDGITVGSILNLRTPAAIAASVEEYSFPADSIPLQNSCPLNNSQQFILDNLRNRRNNDPYIVPSIVSIDPSFTNEEIMDALNRIFAAHPVLTMHVEVNDGNALLVKGNNPPVMTGSVSLARVLLGMTSGMDIYSCLSRHVIVRMPGKCWLVSVFHHMIFDVISNNKFHNLLPEVLNGRKPDYVDDAFVKNAVFQQEIRHSAVFERAAQFIHSMLGNLNEAGFYRNPGKHGEPGYASLKLGTDRGQIQRFTEKYSVNKNLLFTGAFAKTLSVLTGKEDVFFGFVENGRDRFNNYDAIGLYTNQMPIMVHVDSLNQEAFLAHLSEVYYRMIEYSFYPFGDLAKEYHFTPLIFFQFFPDWIMKNGAYQKLPLNETVMNTVLSMQKDFIVEAMTEVLEKEDGYYLMIFYSGYYSRKMIKTLADTYNRTLSEMIQSAG